MCAIEPLSWAPALYFDDPSADPVWTRSRILSETKS